MDLTINIVLVIAGMVTAIAAIGGETWRKEAGPLLHRITTRGWISLGALTVACVLGVAKEVRAHEAASRSELASENLRGQLKDAQRQLDETRRLLQNVVLSNEPSQYVLKKIAEEIAVVARQHGLPEPDNTVFSKQVHYDFRDENQPRQAFLALDKEDVATLSLLPPSELRQTLGRLMFGKWGADNIDADWLTIRDEIAKIALPILEDNFSSSGGSSMTAPPDHKAMEFFMIDDSGKENPRSKLTLSRSEISELLKLPPCRRSALVASRAEMLK